MDCAGEGRDVGGVDMSTRMRDAENYIYRLSCLSPEHELTLLKMKCCVPAT